MLLVAAVCLAGAAAAVDGTNHLRVYPVPMPLLYTLHNDDFTVRVRNPGGTWQDLYEYRIPVDADTHSIASMVYFDFSGTVDIEVEKNNGRFESASVAPLSSGIALRHSGSIVRMTLTRPQRFSIQFDDDRLQNLHILAGPLPAPPPDDSHVRYFGPGLHLPPDGKTVFDVHSGDRIYLDGGAVLEGSFDLTGLHDVRIGGRGLLYDPGRPIDLDHSSDIDVGDLILVNGDRNAAARVMNVRNSQRVTVHGISGFTSGKWSDGINISTSQHVTVDYSYLRTSDDAVVVYAVTDCPICGDHPIASTGPDGAADAKDTFDIVVRNLTIWSDVAHALYVGHFGDNGAPRTIHGITFDNIDVVNLDEDDLPWEGVMAIFSGDSTLIKDVIFRNIRVERIEEGKLINLVSGESSRYNRMPGRGIDGVIFQNITYSGAGLPGRSVISGLSKDSMVRNVSIGNLRVAGRRVNSPAKAKIDVDGDVSNFVLR